MASDRMLRGRSPWGLGGAVYLLVRSFACTRSCVNVRGRRRCFLLRVGGVIECCLSMLDYTGALIREQCSSCYCEGVLMVVVFEILLSENFSPPPQHL